LNRDITNNPGGVQNYLRYYSFGKISSQTNANFSTRFNYTGREFDAETGLYFYRSRYYDPGVGRFLSEDLIGFGGGDANLYRYVGNSPVNFVDPFGFECCDDDLLKILRKELNWCKNQFPEGFNPAPEDVALIIVNELLDELGLPRETGKDFGLDETHGASLKKGSRLELERAIKQFQHRRELYTKNYGKRTTVLKTPEEIRHSARDLGHRKQIKQKCTEIRKKLTRCNQQQKIQQQQEFTLPDWIRWPDWQPSDIPPFIPPFIPIPGPGWQT
jgi:RHS repeat-associated protein